MPVVVDSNVYIGILTRDPVWYAWSSQMLEEAAGTTTIIINPVIYAEISIRFSNIEELDFFLSPVFFDYQGISREVAFLAGKCFKAYRKKGGQKLLPLPDFFIGAHAAVANVPLITRDPKRFRHYFPNLEIIAP